ncbi:MAG: hypothetical protein QHH12_07540 [Candidatus Bathyarchaeota archaeon]|nr:hypothetical protein [Candidatus Bathyarchaeota archaeon A05DMB-3]MDH7607591.1 hypothetical protein [Candidatus Bathyarchaeota archaeon]
MLSQNLAKMILEDFLKNSWHCVEELVKALSIFEVNDKREFSFYHFRNGKKCEIRLRGPHFFLRGSVEYSNPQLTVEEVQGIIAARLLEVCGNYFHHHGLSEITWDDINEICELLRNPKEGIVTSFLLNTDDIEPDRYSMNPLRESIVESGQSAFPSAYVKTSMLKIDENFARKYDGTLISQGEIELIRRRLENSNSYVEMVDAVKYEQMEQLSEFFEIDLCLPSMRMPIETLQREDANGLLHHIIKDIHRSYSSIEDAYRCMGRSMKKRTTLLTVPHSVKGYGSKRAARGKIYFEGEELKSVKVSYQTTPLYPNAIDPEDISMAKAEDEFMVEGEALTNYKFKETPSSPQFFLYSLASPENAALWHGIGAYGAEKLLESYTSIRKVCLTNALIRGLDVYGVSLKTPLQFNLSPKHMWVHPKHRNIDASIGCVENLEDLAKMGMKIEHIPL